MNIFGVGTRFGGVEPFLDDCVKYGFWCMGDNDKKFFDLYKSIEVGDLLVAKKYYPRDGVAVMDVEAVGIVRSLETPKNVPSKYTTSEKYVLSAVWIKIFPNFLTFTSENYKLGDSKTKTIFKLSFEKDKEIIDRLFDNIGIT